MNKTNLEQILFKFLLLLITAVILYRAVGEFYEIAWGTGSWMGEFSRTWAVLYYAFIAFSILIFALTVIGLWKPNLTEAAGRRIITIRDRMGILRWLLWGILLILPVWFFQYTALGFVFQKFYIRVLIWIIVVWLMTVLASKREQLAGWNEFLVSLILTASMFSIAASLKYVNGYPFSFGWSEGNRLWDYSILFGRDRYIYPADKDIPVLLDLGRSLTGGIPFLFSGTGIVTARLWVGLTLIIPYLLLGIALFRAEFKNRTMWFLLLLWTFLFLKQGPIHAPLVISAALVALAWRAPFWIAIPLLLGAGYLTASSRFTWVFAPGIWIVMLEFASASFNEKKSASIAWKRSLILVVLGLFGGLAFPSLIQQARAAMTPPQPVATVATPQPAATAMPTPVPSAEPIAPEEAPAAPAPSVIGKYLQFVVSAVQDQPLLWYRLLPNSTYRQGILLALLLAITPLTIVLIYLSAGGVWQLDRLQKAAVVLPLLAFLAVGLVASTKIGGGGDLHNLDMFLIGMLFVGAIAWQNGGRDWIQNGAGIPLPIKIVIVALLVNSSLAPLLEMRSFTLGEQASWLKTLTDAKSETSMEMLPTQAEIDSALQTIQTEADKAKANGDVLFMDQRQLLTFGYITDIPLVPEYEKKLLMNQGLSSNSAYFREYYADLAAKRFSLIVTEPLRTPIQDSSYQFGEENNAWVKWVANPTLCYYEPLETLKTVRVQLLVPKQGEVDCSAELPKESLP
jgi:hypothetical protein